MGVVRIDDKLIKEVQKWLEENGNKYKHPTGKEPKFSGDKDNPAIFE